MHAVTRELEHIAGAAGIDEAGRGPLAGPVVAAAVWFQAGQVVPGLQDSKRLTDTQREILFDEIRQCSHVGIGVGTVEEIDRVNILRATLLAMRRAFDALGQEPELVVVDGTFVPAIRARSCRAEPKADARYACVAAASIVAKVTRDRLMKQLAVQYPGYGFERHFGYPTPEHLERLRASGPCPIHRQSFRPVAEAQRGSPVGLTLFPELTL
jgi:ribonuclease HII